jgi:hypothetical protein
MEKQANAIYGGTVCDKGEDLRHVDSIVNVKLSAIHGMTHGFCCLLSLIVWHN